MFVLKKEFVFVVLKINPPKAMLAKMRSRTSSCLDNPKQQKEIPKSV